VLQDPPPATRHLDVRPPVHEPDHHPRADQDPTLRSRRKDREPA
jgi:hypothetical protein